MQGLRRSATAWYIAALLPLSLLGVFYLAILLQQRWQLAEDEAVDRARSYVARIDAILDRELAALATAMRLERGHIGAEDGWYAPVSAAFPRWKAVVVVDLSSGKTVWSSATSAENVLLRTFDWASFAGGKSAYGFDGVGKLRDLCLCVAAYQKLDVDGASFALMLAREVSDFYDLLASQAQPGEISALVDRDGAFIVRTLANVARAGTPATEYVRAAVARGGEGVYSGVTYEGLRNRTAYVTSGLTGWSVHIAVPAASYNLLSTGYTAFALFAVMIALVFAGGVTWYGVRDLEAARQQEKARLQSYKLEAVGALSSAIVHDFNNLLAIMNSCLRLLASATDPEKQALILKEGFLALDRGSSLANQLLSFVRDKPLETTCVDLRSAVEAIRDLLTRTLTARTRFDLDISPNARFARANKSQLELVLLNLAANGRDAMPEGGVFAIVSRPSASGREVYLSVSDTGVGMSPDVAARAFEPFFTTKPEGKGTGLGLAQAQLFAKDCGGALSLETAPGKGCTFTFTLRACEPTP